MSFSVAYHKQYFSHLSRGQSSLQLHHEKQGTALDTMNLSAPKNLPIIYQTLKPFLKQQRSIQTLTILRPFYQLAEAKYHWFFVHCYDFFKCLN